MTILTQVSAVTAWAPKNVSLLEVTIAGLDSHGSISDQTKQLLAESRSEVVRALFTFYRSHSIPYPEGKHKL